MSLLDDLRKIADFPISHVPTISEALPILGALVAYVEHGPTVLEAADKGAQELSDLLAGHPAADHKTPPPAVPEVLPGPATPPPAPGPSSSTEDELRAQIASLEQQLQTQLANQQRTTATVEPIGAVEPVTPPAPEAL